MRTSKHIPAADNIIATSNSLPLTPIIYLYISYDRQIPVIKPISNRTGVININSLCTPLTKQIDYVNSPRKTMLQIRPALSYQPPCLTAHYLVVTANPPPVYLVRAFLADTVCSCCRERGPVLLMEIFPQEDIFQINCQRGKGL